MALLLALGGVLGGPVGAADTEQRTVRVVVAEADGSELPGAVVEVCRVPEAAPAEPACESTVVEEGGNELHLPAGFRFEIRARLDGFLSTAVGPIVVSRWRYPADDLLMILNPETQDAGAGALVQEGAAADGTGR